MSKRTKKNSKRSIAIPGYTFVAKSAGIEEFQLKSNGLRVLYHNRPGTGVVTSNITYVVGAKDEERGETGVAHMLEHMLFKPTTFDKKRKIADGGAMHFERTTGCNLNANTWKDRTTYYFTFPTAYLDQAIQIEAERMTGTILTDAELDPERNNVLSEFDMYNGNPHFALSVQMVGVALQSHPYGHETIGYREDIEDYTAAKLERFYRNYYRPDNAVMMIIGDIDRDTALSTVKKHFRDIERPKTVIPRFAIREPKQEGVRRVSIVRPGNMQLLSFGFLHAGFPSKEWFVTLMMNEILAGSEESILHKAFVDTGIVTSVHASQEPTGERNMGQLTFVTPLGVDLQKLEADVLRVIHDVKLTDISKVLTKIKVQLKTEELFERDHSQHIAQELTEYVAAGDWAAYTKTEKILDTITAKEIHSMISELYDQSQLTIGTYTNE